MPTDSAKAIVDYAFDDEGVEMRNALYSAIQDRVMSHIDAKKQEIAHNLIAQPEEPEEELEIADEDA